ncbi:hypothetical protein [Paenisporosarcina sp. NPDC076898]|uniref:hypothetical protein n=1 Tax=unclassified Paenisporosarcina TaxID=2642018 RepID=UPI003D08AD3A
MAVGKKLITAKPNTANAVTDNTGLAANIKINSATPMTNAKKNNIVLVLHYYRSVSATITFNSTIANGLSKGCQT